MKTSRRTAPAMCWCIAAGMVLTALSGAGGGASAAADPGGRADSGAEPGSPRRPARATDRAPVKPDTHQAGRRPATPEGGDASPDDRPPDCHRRPYWPPLWPTPDTDSGRGNAFFLAAATMPAFTPPAVTMPWTTPAAAGIGPAGAASAPESEQLTLTLLAAGPAATAPLGGPLLPTPPPVPPAPARPAPPVSQPPPPAPPAAPPPQQGPPSPGLPQASALAQAAGQALPGLVGLMILTGAGGLVGYRQAKAGFALRAAGTARFLP